MVCLFVLDKYKDHLDRVRRERSEAISTSTLSNGATDIDRMQQGQSDHSIYDQSFTSIHDVSRPNSSATLENGTLRSPLPLSDTAGLRRYRETDQKDNMSMVGYFEGSARDLSNTHQRPELVSVSRKLEVY